MTNLPKPVKCWAPINAARMMRAGCWPKRGSLTLILKDGELQWWWQTDHNTLYHCDEPDALNAIRIAAIEWLGHHGVSMQYFQGTEWAAIVVDERLLLTLLPDAPAEPGTMVYQAPLDRNSDLDTALIAALDALLPKEEIVPAAPTLDDPIGGP